MLPQHGGVPNFKLRISAPFVLLLALVLFTGLMLTLSLHVQADPGDVAAENRTRLCLLITLLLSALILLTATARLWHPHLWNNRKNRRSYGRGKRRHHSSSGRRHS
jgi:hypothetical protein